MRPLIGYIALFVFFGCSSALQKEDLKYLNGYWEIVEVEFANGQKKEYQISTLIDYIALDGLSGFRKKVQPQFNGTYKTSDDAEEFNIVEKDHGLMISYGEGLEQWEEELISLRENEFSVRNQDGNIYRYQRYEPLNLEP